MLISTQLAAGRAAIRQKWRIEAGSHLGDPSGLIPELYRLVTEYPLREHFPARLMIVEHPDAAGVRAKLASVGGGR